MGGPSYQTPYPVSDTKGGKVIWNWGTKEWTPYTPPKPGADAPPGVRVPDSGGEAGGSSAPGMSGTADTNTGGSEQYQVPKGTKPRRRPGGSVSLPGASLLMDDY